MRHSDTSSSRFSTYFDYGATTPLAPEVQQAMIDCWQYTDGNASSLHQQGQKARETLQIARKEMATHLGTQPHCLFFTSGATEANNWLLHGLTETLKATIPHRHLVVSPIEHPSILEPLQRLEQNGWNITFVPVTPEGIVTPEALQQVLRPETALVSIMHGNNEVGTLQDLEALGQLCQANGTRFHTDAVQTIGKWPFQLDTLPVDYVSMSAHKLYGPKGVGALWIRETAPQPTPLFRGGGQEGNLRSGTENIAGIVGFTKALSLCHADLYQEIPRLYRLQRKLIEGIQATIPQAVLNGPARLEARLPGNVNFSFPPIEGEALVLKLAMKGIAVSSGSACHSASLTPSHVLLALGKTPEESKSSLRFSLGRYTTEASIDQLLKTLPPLIQKHLANKTQLTPA